MQKLRSLKGHIFPKGGDFFDRQKRVESPGSEASENISYSIKYPRDKFIAS